MSSRFHREPRHATPSLLIDLHSGITVGDDLQTMRQEPRLNALVLVLNAELLVSVLVDDQTDLSQSFQSETLDHDVRAECEQGAHDRFHYVGRDVFDVFIPRGPLSMIHEKLERRNDLSRIPAIRAVDDAVGDPEGSSPSIMRNFILVHVSRGLLSTSVRAQYLCSSRQGRCIRGYIPCNAQQCTDESGGESSSHPCPPSSWRRRPRRRRRSCLRRNSHPPKFIRSDGDANSSFLPDNLINPEVELLLEVVGEFLVLLQGVEEHRSIRLNFFWSNLS